MRLSSVFAIGGVFLTAAILCLVCARFAVSVVEETSRNSVRNTLDENGMTWTEVDANGLHVFLAGTAPTEARRFKALSIAGSVVDAARVIDQMLVQDTGQIAPPRFSMEILRNDSGVSLIGLVPAAMDREAFVGAVEEAVAGEPVANFLESADYPAPETWEAATDYALRSLKDLKRTKISVDAAQISVTAMTESAAVKADMENKLARRVPEGLKLALNISAPRPVITPFTLRFVSEEGGTRFDACSADTDEARDRIVAAAREAGLTGKANCLVGMGVPTPNWAKAAEQAIGAVKELGGGVVTFSDADISLVALEGTPQGQFDNVVGALESSLPEVFALHAVLPEPPEETTPETPEFTATLSPEGMVQLRGRIATAAERKLVDSFARARFTSDGVHMSARVAEGLPEGWTFRVLTALDALSYLTNGVVRVSPDEMHISGLTGQAEAGSAISGMFSEKLGEGAQYTIDVDYREELDPVASLPTPEECEARIATIQEARKISFEPGSANIDADGSDIMDDIAEILKTCGEITMEIGGHTDSQGREVMNQQLSQERAQTVLNELRMRRVLTASISAVGYGESQPIADNGTEEGREANRRIEFKVILPVEIVEEQTTLETLEGTSEEQSDSDGASDGAGGETDDAAGEAEEGAADAADTGDGDTQEDTADEQD
ncbi:OmpA family protein [Roseovarius sp.]|uniref:OmpA family protein n=1 Tax=Roseovarius sp. TaxID=1486281 RepID=UPI003BA842F4